MSPNMKRYPSWAEECEACWVAVRKVRWITHDDLPLAIEQVLEQQAETIRRLLEGQAQAT